MGWPANLGKKGVIGFDPGCPDGIFGRGEAVGVESGGGGLSCGVYGPILGSWVLKCWGTHRRLWYGCQWTDDTTE